MFCTGEQYLKRLDAFFFIESALTHQMTLERVKCLHGPGLGDNLLKHSHLFPPLTIEIFGAEYRLDPDFQLIDRSSL